MAIVDKINAFLTSTPPDLPAIVVEAGRIAENVFKRQFLTIHKDRVGIGLSECGGCARQSAYKLHGVEKNGREIDSRGRIVFYQGDLVEAMIYLLAKAAGLPIENGGLEQKTISLNISGKDVFGHPDSILKGNPDMLIEIKSMSSYGFSEFEDGMIEPKYLSQINAYLEALNLEKCVMVVMNKDNGLLAERIITRNDKVVAELKDNLLKIITSTKEQLPDRLYAPDEKGIYPWQCLFCAWYGTCIPNAEKVLIKGRWKLKEKEKKTDPEVK